MGQGQTQEQARAALEYHIVESIKNEVTMTPCPGCGSYQPEMIRLSRVGFLSILLVVALVVLVLGLVLSLVGTMVDQLLITVFGGLAVAIALAIWLFGLGNLNGNLEANRARSQHEVETGKLQMTPSTGPPSQPPAFQGQLRHPLTALLLLVGALLPFAAEAYRGLNHWPVNPAWSPQVVGPGDYCWTRFPDRGLQSVKGDWRALSVSAKMVNAREAGAGSEALKADSSERAWGNTISVKSGEKSRTFSPWCGIYVPNDSALAGNTLQVKMDLNIEYPDLRGNNSFENRTRPMSHTEGLVLSSPGAGAAYRRLWSLGTVLGLGLIVVVLGYSIQRLERLKALASPTAVLPTSSEPDGGASQPDGSS
jgi:hypothetical protein